MLCCHSKRFWWRILFCLILIEEIVYESEMLDISENVLLGKDILCREDNKFIIQGTECFVKKI